MPRLPAESSGRDDPDHGNFPLLSFGNKGYSTFTALMRLADRAKFGSVESKEMKNINRRESLRIEIKPRCHVSSPALWMQSAMYTENISRSSVLIAWRGV